MTLSIDGYFLVASTFGLFYGYLLYFVVIWYICGHLVYFEAIWYILWSFGIFLGHLFLPVLVYCTKKIWQPWLRSDARSQSYDFRIYSYDAGNKT
jgi:hypothetical protein